MNKPTPVFKNGAIIGYARSHKQASALLGKPAAFARRDPFGYCWVQAIARNA